MINTKLTIGGLTYEPKKINLSRTTGDFNSTSNINISFDNPFGRHVNDFSLNQEIILYADIDTDPAVTKIFSGRIENIDFNNVESTGTLRIKGRDNGMILQNRIVKPRVFKEKEVSVIVIDIIAQNTAGITINNVNGTTTTVDKITFNNISVFDALKQLAEISGYYFYVDEDSDLHFEEKESTSSGYTLDSTNILFAEFKNNDRDVFNRVEVRGDRLFTGQEDVFTSNGGSVYNLSYKPHNLNVYLSGVSPIIYQPGGLFNIDDPSFNKIKYLVDFQGRRFILVSGTAAGDNIAPAGSVILTNYEKSVPIISVKTDSTSQLNFGLREKIITDQRIKDPLEASIKAISFLDEHKDSVIQGELLTKGIINIIPGNTVVVDVPWQGVDNKTYKVISVNYDFNKSNNLQESVMSVIVNKKQVNFTDTMREEILRLKRAEIPTSDEGIVTLQTNTGSVGISGTFYAIKRSIGSGFFFHTPNHDLFESPTSLLGDVRAGSEVVSGGF